MRTTPVRSVADRRRPGRPERLRRLAIALLAAVVAAVGVTSLALAAGEDRPKHHPRVEQWRPLVEQYWTQYGYGDEVEFALMVMYAESQGVVTALNPTSDASGLFQHLPKFWESRSARAGWAGADIFDPEANIAVAAWLRATSHSRGWYHWAPVWDRTPIGSWGPDTWFDVDRGWYRNMGGGSLGAAPNATHSHPPAPPPRPTVDLAKSSGDAAIRGVRQGSTVTWTYTVTNTWDEELYAVSLWDDDLGEVVCPDRTVPVGASVTCTATQVAEIGKNGAPATVWAWTGDGLEATATATGTYQGIPVTGLELRTAKLSDETMLRFENTGLVDLWSLGVWVDGLGAFECPERDLGPGDIVVCPLPAGSEVGDAWAWTGTGLRVGAAER